jgi:DNA-binding CsgD family transcriptional regulator
MKMRISKKFPEDLLMDPRASRGYRKGSLGAPRPSTTDAARFRLGEVECGYLVIRSQDPHIVGLTQAESGVVALVSSGCSNREIAARRGTSVRTVSNQLAAIFKKLGLSSRNELVELAAGLPRRSDT